MAESYKPLAYGLAFVYLEGEMQRLGLKKIGVQWTNINPIFTLDIIWKEILILILRNINIIILISFLLWI